MLISRTMTSKSYHHRAQKTPCSVADQFLARLIATLHARIRVLKEELLKAQRDSKLERESRPPGSRSWQHGGKGWVTGGVVDVT